MADANNSGQFGQRKDTKKQAAAGGNASTGKFGSKNGADPHKAGQMGAEAQPIEAKAEGGRHSHSGGNNS